VLADRQAVLRFDGSAQFWCADPLVAQAVDEFSPCFVVELRSNLANAPVWR
jgi:hypothetical protein